MEEQNKSVLNSNCSTDRLFDSIRVGKDVVAIQALLQEGVDIDTRDSQGYTPLLLACLHRRKKMVDLLINTGAAVDVKCNSDEYTVLHYASQHGWLKIIRILAKTVPDLDARDIRGETAMHHAARSGRLKVVKCLVKEGADIDIKNFVGHTPVVCAAQCSWIDVVNLLLKSRAKVDGNEGILLYYASEKGWIEVVRYLAERVPDLNKFYECGKTALHVATTNGQLEVVKFLVDSGAEINTRCSYGDTAFHSATLEGHLEIMKYLVDKGAEINSIRYESEETALQLASDIGYIEVVKWLLEKGADTNTLDKNCDTPLHVASAMGRLEIVKCLLNVGTESINKQDIYGMTALHNAADLRRLEIVKCLLGKGIDVNIKNSNGDTALGIASFQGDIEIVKCLLENGSDINVKNFCDKTPVMRAACRSHKDVVYLLMQCGANLDLHKPKKWGTLLHCATGYGWIDIIHFIVKKNCNLDARDLSGYTALSYACIKQDLESAQCLLHAGASWNILDRGGNSPLNYVTRVAKPQFEFIKLFIESGSYLDYVDYEAIVKSFSLKVLQDVELCSQAIKNKYNNHYLPKLYKLPASGCLPRLEEMKIVSGSERAQAIKQTVEFEILTKGHCNILQVRAMVLSVFSVVSLLEYYDKKKLA